MGTMAEITYDNIWYNNCPHFTVGRVDQWGEQGYLFHEGYVYQYHEDRKDQWGETYNKMEIEYFIEHAQRRGVTIPEEFMELILKS